MGGGESTSLGSYSGGAGNAGAMDFYNPNYNYGGSSGGGMGNMIGVVGKSLSTFKLPQSPPPQFSTPTISPTQVQVPPVQLIPTDTGNQETDFLQALMRLIGGA